MKWLIGVLMLLHGFAHFVGVAGSWGLLPREQRAQRTTIMSGRVDLGPRGMQAWGVLWAVAAVAFVVVAVGLATGQPWWFTAALGAAIASLLLTLAEVPDARIGTLINVAIISALVMGRHFNWF